MLQADRRRGNVRLEEMSLRCLGQPARALRSVKRLNRLQPQTLVMQQYANIAQHGHVLRAIKPASPCALHRLDEAQSSLPEAQHMGGHTDFCGGLGNGAERVRPLGHEIGQAFAAASTRPECAPSMPAFMTCEARKLMTRRGSIAAGSPVFGLRPMRARLSRT